MVLEVVVFRTCLKAALFLGQHLRYHVVDVVVLVAGRLLLDVLTTARLLHVVLEEAAVAHGL